jgi:hypothetical protein
MQEIKPKKKLSVSKALREARDVGLDSLAKVVLAVTSSESYSRVSSTLAKPGLVLAGVARRRTDAAMSKLLAHSNMPSRTDVLTLSKRLTNIEMALDDLSAAVDTMRAPPTRAKRAPAANRAPRPVAAQEG